MKVLKNENKKTRPERYCDFYVYCFCNINSADNDLEYNWGF